MNIDDLTSEGEFLESKRALLLFVSERYKGLKFELRDRGFHEDTSRYGGEPARKLLRVDLVGMCAEIVIESRLEIRRKQEGGPLVVEERLSEMAGYGHEPTTVAKLGSVDIEIGRTYSFSDLAELGIDHASVGRTSPFWSVKCDLDRAVVFVVQRLTELRHSLGWRQQEARTGVASNAAEVHVSSEAKKHEGQAAKPVAQGVPRGADLEID